MLFQKHIIINIMEGAPKPYRSRKIRFFVLFLLSMVVFGNQYAFNNPQALEDSMEKDLDIGATQFQLLYTIFAFPNIFATFVIGFLIDFIGVRTGLISLAAGVAVFQLVIAIGGYSYSYTTILIGRMLFGLASESLITAQASMVSYWFKGKQLSLALGIAVTFPELGNAANSFITPLIYQQSNSLGTPLLVSVFICIISLICALSAAYIDKKADTQDQLNRIKVIDQTTETGTQGQTQQIKCQDLKKLKGSFWLIVTLCMFAVALYVPFMDGANRLYQIRFCFSQVSSGQALVVTYVVAAAFSVPLGLLIDKVGYKRYFIMVAMGILTMAQLIILLYPQCSGHQLNGSIVGLAFIGLGYCFYGNCILPVVPLVVRKRITGTAFGIMQMIESIALAFFPLINGSLIQHASTAQIGYRHSSLFFVMIGFIGLLTSFGLFFVSDKVKKKLDHCSKSKMKVQRRNGDVIYSESQTQKSTPQQGQIQITQQKSQQNLRTSLLNDTQRKKINDAL